MQKKKILVVGPALSASGYGEQARFALHSLRKREDIFDIYLKNIPWGKSGEIPLEEELKGWLVSLINKNEAYKHQHGENTQYDISLHITIPNEFEKNAKINIGYTAGIETTKVSPIWISKGNEMDRIIVPSVHSKNVYEQTTYRLKESQSGQEIEYKLGTPIDVCSFPTKKTTPTELDLDLTTNFNFLTVAQWSNRKNMDATIINFLLEFKDDEDAGLIIKSNFRNNSSADKLIIFQNLEILKAKTASKIGKEPKCKLYLVHGDMSEQEIQGLYVHPKVKGYITTTHGEGFGLPIFDAACAGLPVVAPAWSSYIDFLYAPKKDKKTGKVKNKPHFIKIDFDLKPIQKEAVWEGVLQADSQWCWVKENSVRESMRELRKNHQIHLSNAKRLSEHLLNNLTEEKQTKLFADLVYKLDQKEEQWLGTIGEISED